MRRLPLTPGRRWALTLGTPLALATIAYGGLNYVALVAQDSFRVQHAIVGTHVTVGLGSGNLTVVPSTSATGYMGVRGVVNYSLVRPRVAWKVDGNGTTFIGPSCIWIGWSCGANLTLTVHPAAAVTASTGSGDLGVQGLAGPLDLEDGSGGRHLRGQSFRAPGHAGRVGGHHGIRPAGQDRAGHRRVG